MRHIVSVYPLYEINQYYAEMSTYLIMVLRVNTMNVTLVLLIS